MCDRCQKVFSELDLGWQTFEAVTVDEDENGRPLNKAVRMDACPDCAMTTPTRRERKVAALEREAGIGDAPLGADAFTLPDDAAAGATGAASAQ